MKNGISRIEIKDFLVFKGEFMADFCPGVNVLIGENGTGKTTLLKGMEWWIKGGKHIQKRKEYEKNPQTFQIQPSIGIESYFGSVSNAFTLNITGEAEDSVYIPEKDILEHAKGLLPFIEKKQTGFGHIYKNLLVNAQDIPTQKQSKTQAKIGAMITKKIGGTVCWEESEGSFYTLHTDGTRIPFTNEASGYKKLGFLGLLVTSGQLAKGSVLLWDEPENSLNPELIPFFVDILLELQKSGVQIFLATHSYNIARWLELNKKDGNFLKYFNLRKTSDGIAADISDDYISLENNSFDLADDKLFKRVVEISAEKAGVKLG
jgi:energy-coupling factor transporter ATP-binding protein EcfA2